MLWSTYLSTNFRHLSSKDRKSGEPNCKPLDIDIKIEHNEPTNTNNFPYRTIWCPESVQRKMLWQNQLEQPAPKPKYLSQTELWECTHEGDSASWLGAFHEQHRTVQAFTHKTGQLDQHQLSELRSMRSMLHGASHRHLWFWWSRLYWARRVFYFYEFQHCTKFSAKRTVAFSLTF